MKKNLVCAALLCLAAAGCSYQDFGNPVFGSIGDAVDSGKPYVEPPDSQAALDKSRKLARALARWRRENRPEAMDYHVGPDDVLNIEILSLEEPGRMSKLIRTVNKDGSVMLTFGGSVKAAGLTVGQIQQRIRESLEGRVIKNPQVNVSIQQYRGASVVITGAVTKPGIYYLTQDSRSLLELLAEADGLGANAGDELLIVRGGAEPLPESATNGAEEADSASNVVEEAASEVGGQMLVVDLKKLVDEGDVGLNVWIRGGDIITVQQRAKQYVFVLGYVQRPGSYELEAGKALDAIRAVAMAGGLTSAGRAENSFVLRRSTAGQKMIPLDLTKTVRGTRPPIALEPGDTLVVGSSFLAKLSEFVKPTVSAGASFAPVP